MHPSWRAVVLGVLLVVLSPPGHAGEGPGIGVGLTEEIDGERTEVLVLSWLGKRRHPWELAAGYLGRRTRLQGGGAQPTVFVAMSKRLTWRRWFISGGIALSDHDGDVLSGHGQFYTGAGFEAGAWALSLRHLSNGDTGGRNRGETFALLEFRW